MIKPIFLIKPKYVQKTLPVYMYFKLCEKEWRFHL